MHSMYIKIKKIIEVSPETNVETNFIDRVHTLGVAFANITTQTAPVTCQVKSDHFTY